MTSSLYGGHVNLGMIFLSLGWNFRLGVILFVFLSFYVLVQWNESWYDFSPSWLKFSFWCGFVCLGVILCIDAINCNLVWFFFVLLDYFVFVFSFLTSLFECAVSPLWSCRNTPLCYLLSCRVISRFEPNSFINCGSQTYQNCFLTTEFYLTYHNIKN